jgi:hypothetical protein
MNFTEVVDFDQTVTELNVNTISELLSGLEALGCPVHDKTDAEWNVVSDDGLTTRARRAIDSGPDAESFEFDHDKIVVGGKRLKAVPIKVTKDHGPMPKGTFLSSFLLSTTAKSPDMQRIDALVRLGAYAVAHSSHPVQPKGIFDQKFSTDQNIHVYSVGKEMKSKEFGATMNRRIARYCSKTPWPDMDNPWDEYRSW